MKYLMLLHTPAGPPLEQNSVEYDETFAAYAAANAAMASAGVLLDCAPLQPVASSTTVRVRDGRTIVTDGPAAEIKEQVGGYTLVECADLDEALKWAATIPAAAKGWVEVRPVIPTPAPS
ncbi:YciI family protein [Paractinoplanes rhizophilus]|uniref:YciI family protein n=1 Tax=Paractinoplanes rhizophilus TaxID=1416877 RepID=A0ABW2HRE9_9ACTN